LIYDRDRGEEDRRIKWSYRRYRRETAIKGAYPISTIGGVIAFIFADLIILPILNIYRKYYGLKMAGFLVARPQFVQPIEQLV
jgi:hypothetical protein